MSKWQKPGSILPDVLRIAGVEEPFRRHSALLHWDEVVGERIAAKARPRSLDGKVLIVEVESSAWIHELAFQKDGIMKKLNDTVGGGAIERIVFLAVGKKSTHE
ncbi:MAG: DUF721 domain-containing protein [Gemmatimonadetes bacterium]|nr:DUF721 domain-containing protein [Gemmatimonadota bacterium]